jgi:hypothetical protein
MSAYSRYNVRDIFSLFTGRCGHKWVASFDIPDECPVCGDAEWDERWQARHVVSCEPIAVNVGPYVWDKLTRRRAKIIRDRRHAPRKTAAIISLVARRSRLASQKEPLDEHPA